jgi:hypothetical protein
MGSSHRAQRISPWPVAWWNWWSLSTPVSSIRVMLKVNTIGMTQVSTATTARAARRPRLGRATRVVDGWAMVGSEPVIDVMS